MTVARDIEDITQLDSIIKEAETLNKYAKEIIIVPKDIKLINQIDRIPEKFILGYSVPSKYGKTEIPPEAFKNRRVHLLGGRPDVQVKLAKKMNVISADCNRFTLDAKYGDYFVGEKFVPHPIGGYENCLTDSIRNINKIWKNIKNEQKL